MNSWNLTESSPASCSGSSERWSVASLAAASEPHSVAVIKCLNICCCSGMWQTNNADGAEAKRAGFFLFVSGLIRVELDGPTWRFACVICSSIAMFPSKLTIISIEPVCVCVCVCVSVVCPGFNWTVWKWVSSWRIWWDCHSFQKNPLRFDNVFFFSYYILFLHLYWFDRVSLINWNLKRWSDIRSEQPDEMMNLMNAISDQLILFSIFNWRNDGWLWLVSKEGGGREGGREGGTGCRWMSVLWGDFFLLSVSVLFVSWVWNGGRMRRGKEMN